MCSFGVKSVAMTSSCSYGFCRTAAKARRKSYALTEQTLELPWISAAILARFLLCTATAISPVYDRRAKRLPT